MDPLQTQPPAGPAPWAFGPYVLDAEQVRLTQNGSRLALTGRAFDLLCVLVSRAPAVVDKDSLLDAVWGDREVSESALKGAINTLRLALGDDAKAPRFIESVSRRGYRFVAPVHAVRTTVVAVVAGSAKATLPPAGTFGSFGAEAIASAIGATDVSTAFEPRVVARSGNLPFELEPLIARELEQVLLQRHLQNHRLVTITGLGGVGKTRLAMTAAAAQTTSMLPIWLLRLDELSAPDSLLSALGQMLQLSHESSVSAEAMARSLSGESLLLVLDNAEHVLGEVMALSSALLAQAPQVRLLVTSQVPLRLSGEVLLPLAPLGLPTDIADGEPDPDSYDAARLMLARIRQHHPHWEAGPDDAAHMAAVCRALDGVPLALELAAARVPLLGLAGVRARLDQRFALLTRAPRNASARHRTLAAALDWTFGLLSEPERQAVFQLSDFGGSFSIEDCERLLGEDALDLVEELRARSLLIVGHSENGMRLRMFESVRSHALAGLASAAAAVSSFGAVQALPS